MSGSRIQIHTDRQADKGTRANAFTSSFVGGYKVTYRFKFDGGKQNRPDLTLDVQVNPNRLIEVDSQVHVHPFGNITQRGLSQALALPAISH